MFILNTSCCNLIKWLIVESWPPLKINVWIYSELNLFLFSVFAYGQTGCGKSFSMQGITDPPEQRGIIPRAFEHIFEQIDVDEAETKYLVQASYLEIYNEEIRDLLGGETSISFISPCTHHY